MNGQKPKHQLHVLKELQRYRELLQSISLKGRQVIEIGVGTGALTQLILERDPQSVIGYEILNGLCKIDDPRLHLTIGDATTQAWPAIHSAQCLIANPPYSLIPWLVEKLEAYSPQLHDVILMVNPKNLPSFPDFDRVFCLDGKAFEPETEAMEHWVIRRGFQPTPQ